MACMLLWHIPATNRSAFLQGLAEAMAEPNTSTRACLLYTSEVVRRVPTVDYPLLIASAYSGFVIWHAGLSGSIPLDLSLIHI